LQSLLSHRGRDIAFRAAKNWLNVFKYADEMPECELRDYTEFSDLGLFSR
jgi:hypothetical protein